MFLENFRKFIRYFGKRKYLQLAGFTGLSLIAGTLEFVGIALVYPFVMLIITPDTFEKYIPFEINNNTSLGLLIGFSVLLIFLLKNIYMIFTQYIQTKFVCNWKKDITSKFMEYYLYAPYKNIMTTSSSDKLYTIEILCNVAVDGFILRGLNLLTNIIIVLMVISLLLIKFPVPAIVTFIFVTATIALQNKYLKKRTTDLANVMAEKYRKYKNAIMDNILNLKELKILSSEDIFYKNYLKNEKHYRNTQILQGFYSAIPPYIIEILTVLSLLILAYFLSIQAKGNNPQFIASFAIIAASLFRIAPALNRIQTSIININATRDFVKKINDEYEKCDLGNFKKYNNYTSEKLTFKNKIQLKNVNFSYNSDKQVIKNVSLDINKGDFIGIIGLSGAGKSTLADIITGLLPIDSGEIVIDGQKLDETNFYKFRRIIGYVPQQINILDKSFKENVAWGCETIDEEGVIKALKAAQIYDVIKQYPQGINSEAIIGSNGLSQGQKQRIAIARALYRDPEILILDEATSALDVQVEHEITEVLKQINTSKTIISIAHRLSTLRSCNKLVYMKDGQIVDIGTFDDLSSRYKDFERLIELSSIK